MSKTPITISATTLGRAQHIPGYHQRQYMDEGDIPNHIAATLAFIRKDLKPNEKVIVQDRKIYIVEKTALDRLRDRLAGWKLERSSRLSSLLGLKAPTYSRV